jgi:hypothetical protein
MRVLVCGGRKFSDSDLLNRTLNELHAIKPFSAVMHGTQKGADALADNWATANHIPVARFRPEWKKYGGRAAGPIRNARMLAEGKPDLVIAFPGGKGTKNMMDQTFQAGVKLLVVR